MAYRIGHCSNRLGRTTRIRPGRTITSTNEVELTPNAVLLTQSLYLCSLTVSPPERADARPLLWDV